MGNWLNDKANGYGKLFHADGDLYEGEWLEDKANGRGMYTHANGAKYNGEWKDGLPHGTGVYKAYMQDEYPPSGETEVHYQGQFKFGLKDGEIEL